MLFQPTDNMSVDPPFGATVKAIGSDDGEPDLPQPIATTKEAETKASASPELPMSVFLKAAMGSTMPALPTPLPSSTLGCKSPKGITSAPSKLAIALLQPGNPRQNTKPKLPVQPITNSNDAAEKAITATEATSARTIVGVPNSTTLQPLLQAPAYPNKKNGASIPSSTMVSSTTALLAATSHGPTAPTPPPPNACAPIATRTTQTNTTNGVAPERQQRGALDNSHSQTSQPKRSQPHVKRRTPSDAKGKNLQQQQAQPARQLPSKQPKTPMIRPRLDPLSAAHLKGLQLPPVADSSSLALMGNSRAAVSGNIAKLPEVKSAPVAKPPYGHPILDSQEDLPDVDGKILRTKPPGNGQKKTEKKQIAPIVIDSSQSSPSPERIPETPPNGHVLPTGTPAKYPSEQVPSVQRPLPNIRLVQGPELQDRDDDQRQKHHTNEQRRRPRQVRHPDAGTNSIHVHGTTVISTQPQSTAKQLYREYCDKEKLQFNSDLELNGNNPSATNSGGVGQLGQSDITLKQQGRSKMLGVEQPGRDQPGRNQQAREQPTREQPGSEQPAKEQPAREQPAREQPAREQPAREHPAREQPAKDQTSTAIEQMSTAKNVPAKHLPSREQIAEWQKARREYMRVHPLRESDESTSKGGYSRSGSSQHSSSGDRVACTTASKT
ncbi:hypothetical protein DFH27DRAFT_651213 [Peziza echinospora]|nr:hypothetical protein DFH27DRAFT_651213 [Peziza echinospora]